MRRALGYWWPICLLLGGAGVAVAQTPAIVTTLPHPIDDAPTIRPLTTLGQNIPPAAVLLRPDAVPEPPPPPSAAAQGLTREIDFHGTLDAPFEVFLLFPSVRQNLNAVVNVGTLYSTTAQLPSAPLHFTAAPTFNLRFNFRDLGEFGASYRLLASQGDATVSGIDPAGPVALRSRLDMQVLDLNYYATGDAGIWWGGPFSQLDNESWRPARWSVNWDVGARMASIYFDSRALGSTIDRHISNFYFGGGPRVGLTLTRMLGDTNLALYGRVDTSAVMGAIQQQFSELAMAGGSPLAFGYTLQRQGQAVPMLSAQIGLAIPSSRFGHWEFGYQYEQWWLVGDIGSSTASVLTQGLFARWAIIY